MKCKFCYTGFLYSVSDFIIFISYVTSWIETRQAQSEKANLTILFDKYVPYCLEQVRCHLKTITPIPENSMVQVQAIHFIFMPFIQSMILCSPYLVH